MKQAQLKMLTNKIEIETVPVLKMLNRASRKLAELKGEVKTIPNEEILINTLSLQEAKDSSAIENIITTQDDLYRSTVDDTFDNIAAKEVRNYSNALWHGFKLVKKHYLITNNDIVKIHGILEPNKKGVRKVAGTVLKDSSGKKVYTPPTPEKLPDYLTNLEQFINDDDKFHLDPLLKMAIIHSQFESIHPFYDGNGRTGRIINILYLVKEKLLDIPVLYLSRYIIQNKAEYYKLLQQVFNDGVWEKWILWMLKGIEQTSKQTIALIGDIRNIIEEYQEGIQSKFKFYSRDLIDSLFKHPYTKIEFIENDLKVHRNTASTYLNKLTKAGYLNKIKLGKNNYYVNVKLFDLFKNE